MKQTRCSAALLAAASLVASGSVHAHGDQGHQPNNHSAIVAAEQTAFGIAGNPGKAGRVITFSVTDDMRFDPSHIEVKQGETIRFVVKNDGKLMHEMVIGTLEQLQEHAEQMRKFPGMEHDEPYMAHVPPGATQELVWTFNRPGQFHFACLIEGHFVAGMMGTVKVGRTQRSHS